LHGILDLKNGYRKNEVNNNEPCNEKEQAKEHNKQENDRTNNINCQKKIVNKQRTGTARRRTRVPP